ncbi:MAG: hypothetical protein JWL85_654 [Candidatus Saccharibacteria bacterium]|nr:hypothetical protein [Candidatus Saccharibacteria bacterium]
MTQVELPLGLPPADYIREFAASLDTETPRDILDAGCGTGRHGLHLAQLGHNVVNLSNDIDELDAARRNNTRAGELAGKNTYIAGDIRRPPFARAFDIVLSDDVLHLMPKTHAFIALDALRNVTRQGGLNIIGGYLVQPGMANVKNTARCFHPGELSDIYTQAGWKVLKYKEQYKPNQYIVNGAVQKEIISSRALIIAQRPWLDNKV